MNWSHTTHTFSALCAGTPGVGKSTLCEQLAESTGLEWLEVGKIAKDYECFEGFDEVYQCPVLDEDKVCSTHYLGFLVTMCVADRGITCCYKSRMFAVFSIILSFQNATSQFTVHAVTSLMTSLINIQ
jgi:broad-specificity NMP kinase